MLKRLLKIVSIGILVSSLIGCETATIIDLYHAETEEIPINEEAFMDSANNPYIVGGVFFNPYMVQSTFGSSDTEYFRYSLYLNAYKKADNPSQAVINHIKIVGKKDVIFKEIIKDLSIPLQFSDDEHFPPFKSSDSLLVEETNNYNMELTKNSVITVIINVTVEENGEKVTKDLTYDFVTRFRTYAVTR
ncbi:hypothetical protein DZB84_19590 [Bacillus sp. HNG]|uniref:hypothetical protein n=1 Tax=Bacillus sp. HNG TaxID=2293325 RepID=UPI000E2EAF22|nr:hypothetical protein [Bacillus sp. HNG]RFB12159.1 hypothetical protein DZB84_19590 [Bacillus sp. HNG]